jgi:hypothetical protein
MDSQIPTEHTKSLSDVTDRCPAIYQHNISIKGFVTNQLEEVLRTAHDYSYITHKAMHDLESLSNGHASLLMGKTVESLQHSFDLTLS